MSIKPLPRDAVDKIKSSVAITTLNGVINGLLKNSLDASATKVYVTLDYTKGDCSLEDNGYGIPPEEFGEAGGLGKLHHTSRQPPSSDVHGRRGDFIAALAGLSLLSVTSKHINHRTQNAVLIHNGQVIARRCPADLEQHITTFDNGTRVIVRDLFGALPVRVKQRASTSFDKAATQKQWSSLVRDVLALLLAWPIGVLVVMRNNADGRELRLKSPPATTGCTSRASALLVQASLVDHLDESCWIPVSSSSRAVTVSGCISLCPLPTRQAQFLTFGIQPVDSSRGTNVLFEEINRVFRNSSFGSNDDPMPSSQIDDSLRVVQGRRGPIQHPMFYLRIDFNNPAEAQFGEGSVFDSDHQLLQVIIDVLRAICYGFLKSHHMRPNKITRSSDRSLLSTARQLGHSNPRKTCTDTSVRKAKGPSPSPSIIGRPSSPFDGWNRLKVGVASTSRPKSIDGPTEFGKQRLIGPDGVVLRKPFQESAPASSDDTSSLGCGDDVTDLGQPGDSNSQTRAQRSGSENDRNTPTQWLADVMRSWKNPVFENVEPAVPTAHRDWSSNAGECSHHWSNDDLGNAIFDSTSVGIRNRLHRDALVSAEVIDQVDNKFILVKLPLLKDEKQGQETPTTLVMLDQHAVDERCRLEDLLASYFSKSSTGTYIARSEALDKAIVFDITEKEAELLEHYQEHFMVWGVMYAVQRSKFLGAGTSSKCLVKVHNLPLSIMERCRSEPRLLINVLRNEIWHLSDGGLASGPRTSPSSDSKHTWVSLFRGCPRGILDLLHSRSCRSAIMFNDSLTKQDCAGLLERLSRCAFPFQCAHGRPSMAPILNMGTEPRLGAWTDEETKETRVSAWERWMRT